MNIQQYYRSIANASLNSSFAAFIPVIVFIFPIFFIFPKRELVMLAAPFLIYSIFSYLIFLLNNSRSTSMETCIFDKKEKIDLFEKDQLLLVFMPAPSLGMLIFSSDGLLNGEIRDLYYTKIRWFLPYFIDRMLPAVYSLYDADNQKIATFKWREKRSVEIICGDYQLTIKQDSSDANHWISSFESKEINIQSHPLFTDVHLMNEMDLMIARVRKGWMPLEWGEFFKDANTPVLSFDKTLSKPEKLFILVILIHIYRYRNH